MYFNEEMGEGKERREKKKGNGEMEGKGVEKKKVI